MRGGGADIEAGIIRTVLEFRSRERENTVFRETVWWAIIRIATVTDIALLGCRVAGRLYQKGIVLGIPILI